MRKGGRRSGTTWCLLELGLVNEMERRPDARRHDLVDGTKLQQRSLDNPDP